MKYRINEIFHSISGEAGYFRQGSWCTFIRLQGCNLDCKYCDTQKSREEGKGEAWDVPSIIEQVTGEPPNKRVIITGGEPLLQLTAPSDDDDYNDNLLSALRLNSGAVVQIETNGSLPISDELAYWVDFLIVDYKLKSSFHYLKGFELDGFFNRMPQRERNYVIKFVISSYQDFVEATFLMNKINQDYDYDRPFIASPVDGDVSCAKAMMEHFQKNDVDMSKVVLSLQIHKLIGME